MRFAELFSPSKIRIATSSVFVLFSLYIMTSLKFVETLPATCLVTYPFQVNLPCSVAQILSFLSIIVLIVAGVYLVILCFLVIGRTLNPAP